MQKYFVKCKIWSIIVIHVKILSCKEHPWGLWFLNSNHCLEESIRITLLSFLRDWYIFHWNFAWNPLPSHSLRGFHYFFVSLLLFLSYSCSLCSREEANWAVFVCIRSCFMCWQDLLLPLFGRWIWDGGLAATLGIAWI